MGSKRKKPKSDPPAPAPPKPEPRSRVYTVSIDRQASKTLLSLPTNVQRQIGDRITALATDPRPHGSQKLKGSDNLHRIRSGDYRIIYTIRDDQLLVLVVRIGDREDVYYDL